MKNKKIEKKCDYNFLRKRRNLNKRFKQGRLTLVSLRLRMQDIENDRETEIRLEQANEI